MSPFDLRLQSAARNVYAHLCSPACPADSKDGECELCTHCEYHKNSANWCDKNGTCNTECKEGWAGSKCNAPSCIYVKVVDRSSKLQSDCEYIFAYQATKKANSKIDLKYCAEVANEHESKQPNAIALSYNGGSVLCQILKCPTYDSDMLPDLKLKSHYSGFYLYAKLCNPDCPDGSQHGDCELCTKCHTNQGLNWCDKGGVCHSSCLKGWAGEKCDIQPCEGQGGIFTQRTGQEVIPPGGSNPPGTYDPGMDCYWQFDMGDAPGISLTLTFNSFQIDDPDCNDWLKIYYAKDGSSAPVGTYCGTNVPPRTSVVNGQYLFMHFHSNQEKQYGGAEFSWTSHTNECHSNPCLNEATCVDGEDSYTCACPATWSGTLCETRLTCHSDPCMNMGTCIHEDNWTYTCQCYGYDGIHCESSIDECKSNPCQNGGTCTDGIALFTCTCPYGYTGVYCEIKQRCLFVWLNSQYYHTASGCQAIDSCKKYSSLQAALEEAQNLPNLTMGTVVNWNEKNNTLCTKRCTTSFDLKLITNRDVRNLRVYSYLCDPACPQNSEIGTCKLCSNCQYEHNVMNWCTKDGFCNTKCYNQNDAARSGAKCDSYCWFAKVIDASADLTSFCTRSKAFLVSTNRHDPRNCHQEGVAKFVNATVKYFEQDDRSTCETWQCRSPFDQRIETKKSMELTDWNWNVYSQVCEQECPDGDCEVCIHCQPSAADWCTPNGVCNTQCKDGWRGEKCDGFGNERLIDGFKYRVNDSQLSSSTNESEHGADRARLYRTAWGQDSVYSYLNSAWKPTDDDANPWIQVDFERMFFVTAIATQGGPAENWWQCMGCNRVVYLVTSYKVKYSHPQQGDFVPCGSKDGSERVFPGNSDVYSVVPHTFTPGFVTQKVRLYPQTSTNGIALRWELYGEEGENCKYVKVADRSDGRMSQCVEVGRYPTGDNPLTDCLQKAQTLSVEDKGAKADPNTLMLRNNDCVILRCASELEVKLANGEVGYDVYTKVCNPGPGVCAASAGDDECEMCIHCEYRDDRGWCDRQGVCTTQCTDIWSGPRCDVFDECNSNPCLNGATCNDEEGKYTCTCDGDWTGVNCETLTKCMYVKVVDKSTNMYSTCDQIAFVTDIDSIYSLEDCLTIAHAVQGANVVNWRAEHISSAYTPAKCSIRRCSDSDYDLKLVAGGNYEVYSRICSPSGCVASAQDGECEQCVHCEHEPPGDGSPAAWCDRDGVCLTTCTGLWTGPKCDVLGPCRSGPCREGATCQQQPEGGGYTCLCPDGQEGVHCEIYTSCLYVKIYGDFPYTLFYPPDDEKDRFVYFMGSPLVFSLGLGEPPASHCKLVALLNDTASVEECLERARSTTSVNVANYGSNKDGEQFCRLHACPNEFDLKLLQMSMPERKRMRVDDNDISLFYGCINNHNNNTACPAGSEDGTCSLCTDPYCPFDDDGGKWCDRNGQCANSRVEICGFVQGFHVATGGDKTYSDKAGSAILVFMDEVWENEALEQYQALQNAHYGTQDPYTLLEAARLLTKASNYRKYSRASYFRGLEGKTVTAIYRYEDYMWIFTDDFMVTKYFMLGVHPLTPESGFPKLIYEQIKNFPWGRTVDAIYYSPQKTIIYETLKGTEWNSLTGTRYVGGQKEWPALLISGDGVRVEGVVFRVSLELTSCFDTRRNWKFYLSIDVEMYRRADGFHSLDESYPHSLLDMTAGPFAYGELYYSGRSFFYDWYYPNGTRKMEVLGVLDHPPSCKDYNKKPQAMGTHNTEETFFVIFALKVWIHVGKWTDLDNPMSTLSRKSAYIEIDRHLLFPGIAGRVVTAMHWHDNVIYLFLDDDTVVNYFVNERDLLKGPYAKHPDYPKPIGELLNFWNSSYGTIKGIAFETESNSILIITSDQRVFKSNASSIENVDDSTDWVDSGTVSTYWPNSPRLDNFGINPVDNKVIAFSGKTLYHYDAVNGRWVSAGTVSPPSSQADCVYPRRVPRKARVTFTGSKPGDRAIYACVAGATQFGGDTEKMCQINGSWTGEDIICEDGSPQAIGTHNTKTEFFIIFPMKVWIHTGSFWNGFDPNGAARFDLHNANRYEERDRSYVFPGIEGKKVTTMYWFGDEAFLFTDDYTVTIYTVEEAMALPFTKKSTIAISEWLPSWPRNTPMNAISFNPANNKTLIVDDNQQVIEVAMPNRDRVVWKKHAKFYFEYKIGYWGGSRFLYDGAPSRIDEIGHVYEYTEKVPGGHFMVMLAVQGRSLYAYVHRDWPQQAKINYWKRLGRLSAVPAYYIDCGQPVTPPHALMSLSGTTTYAIATFRCAYLYEQTGGDRERVCEVDGSWSGDPIVCTWPVVDCGYLPVPAYSYMEIAGISFNDRATFWCHDGYQQIGGDRERVCLSDGTWSGTDIQCKALRWHYGSTRSPDEFPFHDTETNTGMIDLRFPMQCDGKIMNIRYVARGHDDSIPWDDGRILKLFIVQGQQTYGSLSEDFEQKNRCKFSNVSSIETFDNNVGDDNSVDNVGGQLIKRSVSIPVKAGDHVGFWWDRGVIAYAQVEPSDEEQEALKMQFDQYSQTSWPHDRFFYFTKDRNYCHSVDPAVNAGVDSHLSMEYEFGSRTHRDYALWIDLQCDLKRMEQNVVTTPTVEGSDIEAMSAGVITRLHQAVLVTSLLLVGLFC